MFPENVCYNSQSYKQNEGEKTICFNVLGNWSGKTQTNIHAPSYMLLKSPHFPQLS